MRKLFITLLGSIMLTSCATIVSGTSQKINFNSNPSNATVYINEMEMGKTPFETKLERKKDHYVTIKLDGYKPFETKITRSFNPWYLGNAVFGGLIGIIIDPITGAIFRLTPNQVNAQLQQGVTFSKSSKSDIYIAVSLEKDPTWKMIGKLEKQ